jgi:3-oxoadipate enol-lactonase
MNSEVWDPLWDELPGIQHIALDLPGHGYSLPLEPRVDMPTLIAEIAAIVQEQGVRHVVGLSLGSVISLQLAARAELMLRSVALIGPILGGGPYDDDIWRRYGQLRAMRAAGASIEELNTHWMSPDSTIFRDLDLFPALSDHLRRRVAPHPWWDLADGTYERAWHWPQPLRELHSITAAMLVLVGSLDCSAVHAASEMVRRARPGTAVVDLPGCHHLCALESPTVVANLLRRHWMQADAGAREDVTHG